MSASSSAKSGDARTGDVGISIGGINTTGTNSGGGVPQWIWIAAAVLVALMFLKRGRL